MSKSKKRIVLFLGISMLFVVFFVWLNYTQIISAQEAQAIAEKAATPPKTLIPREKWELRQINGKMGPQFLFLEGKPKIIYKFDIYYVDDALDLAYYGRTIFINAFSGEILKKERAPETRY